MQEIVSRTHEVFSYMRNIQPPFGSQNMGMNFGTSFVTFLVTTSFFTDKAALEKQQRLKDVLGGITAQFQRLRVCFEKANEQTANMVEYTQLESLIPLKDEREMKNEIEKKRGEQYKLALEEHNELILQLTAKNRHIKEIIDQMRNIIWEINTMLAMR